MPFKSGQYLGRASAPFCPAGKAVGTPGRLVRHVCGAVRPGTAAGLPAAAVSVAGLSLHFLQMLFQSLPAADVYSIIS